MDDLRAGSCEPASNDMAAAAEPQDSDGRTFDAGVLVEMVGDDPALLAEICADYRDGVRQFATQIMAAQQAGRTAEVVAIAHKLKSSSRLVGAIRLGELSARLEAGGRQGDAASAARLVPEVLSEIEAALALMRVYAPAGVGAGR
ncbi:MAG TPA: Hpt domain-containing protein [Burkholderiaceae bacterium]